MGDLSLGGFEIKFCLPLLDICRMQLKNKHLVRSELSPAAHFTGIGASSDSRVPARMLPIATMMFVDYLY